MPRALARDHDQKRAALLKGAATVFAREGYASASMIQVAEGCGVSKATLYHYYDSKEALLFAILDGHLSTLRDRICGLQIFGGARKKLIGIATEILLAYEGMDAEHRLQAEAMSALPPDRQEVLKAYQRDMVALVREVFSAVTPDLDAQLLREATMSFFGMLNWFYMWNPEADRAARMRYASTVAVLTLGGIRRLA